MNSMKQSLYQKFKGMWLIIKFPASYGIRRHIIIFKTHISEPHSDLPKLCPQLYVVLKINFNPLKTEIHLNTIQKLSFHLTENTFFITRPITKCCLGKLLPFLAGIIQNTPLLHYVHKMKSYSTHRYHCGLIG